MISIGAVPVLRDELDLVSAHSDIHLEESAYLIAIIILLGVYARACSAIRSHRLISILSEVENILLLIVVHTLDHLGPDQRAFRNDSLQ